MTVTIEHLEKVEYLKSLAKSIGFSIGRGFGRINLTPDLKRFPAFSRTASVGFDTVEEAITFLKGLDYLRTYLVIGKGTIEGRRLTTPRKKKATAKKDVSKTPKP